MSDEHAPDPAAPASQAGEKTVSEPGPSADSNGGSGVFEAFVRGGTTSSLHDAHLAKSIFEAEERRKAADADNAKQGAKIYTNKLTEHGNVPKVYVLLDYLTSRGEPLYDHGLPVQCLADVVILNPDDPNELTLILVCPACMARMPPGSQQFCQIQIRQGNRAWHLDQRTAGTPIPFEGHFYMSAGVVMESERFTCPQCTWTARIDKNRVWPEA